MNRNSCSGTSRWRASYRSNCASCRSTRCILPTHSAARLCCLMKRLPVARFGMSLRLRQCRFLIDSICTTGDFGATQCAAEASCGGQSAADAARGAAAGGSGSAADPAAGSSTAAESAARGRLVAGRRHQGGAARALYLRKIGALTRRRRQLAALLQVLFSCPRQC